MLEAAAQTHVCQCTVDFQGKFCETRELKSSFEHGAECVQSGIFSVYLLFLKGRANRPSMVVLQDQQRLFIVYE